MADERYEARTRVIYLADRVEQEGHTSLAIGLRHVGEGMMFSSEILVTWMGAMSEVAADERLSPTTRALARDFKAYFGRLFDGGALEPFDRPPHR